MTVSIETGIENGYGIIKMRPAPDERALDRIHDLGFMGICNISQDPEDREFTWIFPEDTAQIQLENHGQSLCDAMSELGADTSYNECPKADTPTLRPKLRLPRGFLFK
jgi:hypothetical protein